MKEKDKPDILEWASPSRRIAAELGEASEVRLLINSAVLMPLKILVSILKVAENILEEERDSLVEEVKEGEE